MAAKYLLGDGFKDWEDVTRLDPEDVDIMLRNTRKPGGGLEGHCVPTMSAKRLKVLVYIFRYFVRTQYYLNLDRIGLETIRRYERHMKVEADKSHTIVQENLPTIKGDMMNAP